MQNPGMVPSFSARGRLNARQHTPFLAFVACVAAACCLVLSSTRRAPGKPLELLGKGGVPEPLAVALRRAFASGFTDGERHVKEDQALSAKRTNQEGMSQSLWGDRSWQAAAKQAKQQAIARIEGRRAEAHTGGQWQEYAFAPDIPFRRQSQSLSQMMGQLEEQKADVGREIASLKHEVSSEQREAARLRVIAKMGESGLMARRQEVCAPKNGPTTPFQAAPLVDSQGVWGRCCM